MSSVEVGRRAEEMAAGWLQSHGSIILDRNWRNRWCELDIVCSRGGVIHFIEVKYRRRPDFGTGLEYITPDKSARLRRAAMMWLRSNGRQQADYQIDVIAVSGAITDHNLDYVPNAIGSE